MKKQIIKDCKGQPVSVLVDYRDWLQIRQIMARYRKETDPPENPLDWYTLTETSSSILNEIKCYTGREERKERDKENPDHERLERLEALFEEVYAIDSNPHNFFSAKKMEAIIDKYAPMVRAMYEGHDLV